MKQLYILISLIFTFTACLPLGGTGGGRVKKTACTVENDQCATLLGAGYFCLENFCAQCDDSGSHNCTSTTEPVCYRNSCVECTSDNQTLCTNDGKICGNKHTCQAAPVTCSGDEDCSNQTINKKCDVDDTNVCVQCLSPDLGCENGQICSSTHSCIDATPTFTGFPAYIKAPENQANSHFGFSLAMNGDKLIVGSPAFDVTSGADNQGKVYYYQISGAEGVALKQQITFATGTASRLGYSLSLSSTKLLVHSNNGDASGRLDILPFNSSSGTWDGSASVFPLEAGFLAWSNTITENNIYAFGSPKINTGKGKVSFYNIDSIGGYKTDYTYCQGPENNSLFGYSISSVQKDANTSLIVVGAPSRLNNKGSIYLYEYLNGSSGPDLTDKGNKDNNNELNEYFGTSVSIAKSGSGYYVLVGAPGCAPDYSNGYNCGSQATGYAKLYTLDSDYNFLVPKDGLTIPAPSGSVAFGYKVVITDDLDFFISDPRFGNKQGRVYRYKVSTGFEVQETIQPFNGFLNTSTQVNFGGSLAAYGDYLAVGSFTDDTNCSGIYSQVTGVENYCQINTTSNEDSGAVYLYKF